MTRTKTTAGKQAREPLTELERIEALGYDSGKNGANLTNCDFRIFSTGERTRAWERGNEKAQQEIKLAAVPVTRTKGKAKKR
jgi:hypothetical protein